MQETVSSVGSNRIAEFIRTVISAVVEVSGRSDVSTARVRFIDPDKNYNNFEWIMCDHFAAGEWDGKHLPERVWAHTNDFDLMAGSPLSFSAVAPVESRQEMIDAIVAYLTSKFSRAVRVEIRLETDPFDYSRKQAARRGESSERMFLDYVGDSDSGMEGIKPFQSPLQDLPA